MEINKYIQFDKFFKDAITYSLHNVLIDDNNESLYKKLYAFNDLYSDSSSKIYIDVDDCLLTETNIHFTFSRKNDDVTKSDPINICDVWFITYSLMLDEFTNYDFEED